MRDSDFGLICGMCGVILGFMIGTLFGQFIEQGAWIRLVVDKPKYIEAVRQQEIKRRDAQAALMEKTE